MIDQLEIEVFEGVNEAVANRIVAFAEKIPEFDDSYNAQEYLRRMFGKKSLIQFAYVQRQPAGFKLGYEQDSFYFYSWMGGILPMFRKKGVAIGLAKAQEAWANKNNYHFIRMKTRNYLKNMLHFALSNDFYITGIEEYSNPMSNRILLEKKLRD